MNRTSKFLMSAALLTLAAAPVRAQAPTGLAADLIKDITEAEEKITGLANALNATQYDWRPGKGVRSVGEVVMHVAADNYFMPAAMGVAAPAKTKINATDFAALKAYEEQKLDRAARIAEMKASFAHLKKAIAAVPESRMNESMKVFGQTMTVRAFLVLTTTHVHEHLGQMIAYARSNNVTPPWSR
jgi:uncharacterized damage-inducible protein DinB